MARLARRLADDQRLQPEILRARREFFGADRPIGAQMRGAADTAEHRFAEWFALERECDTLGGIPADLPAYADDAIDLQGSMVGVYLVQATAVGGASARDLQDDSILDLWVPADSLQAGDLVVGRLYPAGSGAWTPSTAAAIFRPGVDIGQAFLRDVRRLDLERRLFQVELEHLLLRRPDQERSPTATAGPVVPLEHLEADLDRLLQEADSELSATAISEQLAMAVRPGPVMGPLLDELAFDTEIDLDRVRQLLVAIWNSHHAEDDIAPPSASGDGAPPIVSSAPGETLGERLVRTLDEGLAQKRDVEELFAQLERMAGIEPDAEDEPANPFDRATADDDDSDERADDDRDRRDDDDDDDDDDPRDDAEDEVVAAADEDDGTVADEPRDDDAGNLSPLIEEYLWETDQSEGPAAAPLRLFAALPQNAALPNLDLERVTATDLLRFLLHVYLGAAPTQRSAAVRAAFAELGGFFRWAEATQEMALGPVLDACRGALLDQIDRLQAAGEALSTVGKASPRPGILQIEQVAADGFGVRDDDGDDHWLAASAEQTRHLLRGDLLLGAIAPGPAGGRLTGLVVVLPQDARALME